MPLYEYKCDTCGERFEVMQKFSDEPLKIHEKCGGAAQRLISVPALQFKGSGFYITDYGKGGKPAENGGSQKGDASAGKPSSGSDSGTSAAPASTSSSESKSSASDSKSSSSDSK